MNEFRTISRVLEKFNVDEKIISQINEGFGTIDSKTPKKESALYFKQAVESKECGSESVGASQYAILQSRQRGRINYFFLWHEKTVLQKAIYSGTVRVNRSRYLRMHKKGNYTRKLP